MKTRALFVVLLSAVLVEPAESKCAYHPEIGAEVTIYRCVAVTFSAADVRYTFGPPGSQEDAWPMNNSGDALSGTLLTVSVKRAHYVWKDSMGHYTGGMPLWKKGESQTLFANAQPSGVCPQILPADVSVETLWVCCDSGGWECLLPPTMPLVRIKAVKSGE
jgi:hypothetical protein